MVYAVGSVVPKWQGTRSDDEGGKEERLIWALRTLRCEKLDKVNVREEWK